MKMIAHANPEFLKNTPFHLVKIPWVATTGMPECPSEYNNCLHAAVHSLLAAMQCEEMKDVQSWMKTAKRQLTNALRESSKPGAKVPTVGAVYDYQENSNAS